VQPVRQLSFNRAGTIFAFLFSAFGYIVVGDARRSIPWLLGLVVGSTLGTYAVRGGGATAGGNPNAPEVIDVGLLATMAAASFVGSAAFYIFAPAGLMFEHALASFTAALAAWLAQPLSSAPGRAAALLEVQAALAWLGQALNQVASKSGQQQLQPAHGGSAAEDAATSAATSASAATVAALEAHQDHALGHPMGGDAGPQEATMPPAATMPAGMSQRVSSNASGDAGKGLI
jgi:hypothetical protein